MAAQGFLLRLHRCPSARMWSIRTIGCPQAVSLSAPDFISSGQTDARLWLGPLLNLTDELQCHFLAAKFMNLVMASDHDFIDIVRNDDA